MISSLCLALAPIVPKRNLHIVLPLGLIITGICGHTRAFSMDNIPGRDMKLIRAVFETDRASRAENALWPGFTPLLKPLLLNSETGGTYILNPTFKPKGFTELKTDTGATFYHNPDAVKNKEAKFLLDYDYGGFNAAFFNYGIEDGVEQMARLIIHETFHKYQHRYFRQKTPAPPVEADPKRNSAFYIEQVLLARALISPDSWQSDFRTFIDLRLGRRAWDDAAAGNYEDQQEAFEGSAQYVELKSAEPGNERGMIVTPSDIYLAHMLLIPIEKSSEQMKYYLTGAAQMRLLTRLRVPWQSRIQNGESIFTLSSEQLAGKGLDSRSLKKLLANYGAKNMQESFSRTAAAYNSEVNAIQAELEAGDSKKFILTTWDANILKNSGYTSGPLGARQTAEGTLYPSIRNFEINDGNILQLIFRNTSMFKKNLRTNPIQDKNRVTIHPTQLKSLLGRNEQLRIKIDGKPITGLSSVSTFKSIEIDGEKIYLKTSRPGKISKQGESILVELQPGQ